MNMDYDNRKNDGNRAAKIGIVGNIILTILNAVIGLAAGSTALVAEAADNFADIISSLIGLIAFRVGLKPADKDHPYGHGRIEPIVGLFIALLLLYIAYQIFLDAYTKFVMLNSLTPPGWIAAGMALVALVINMYMSVYLLKTGKKINSHVITATGNQKRVDVLACVAVAGGVVGSQLGYPILDPILAVIIGFLIVKTALEMGRENFNSIMGKVPPNLEDKISKVVLYIREVKSVDNIKINPVGPYYYAEMDIYLDKKMPVEDAYQITNQVEKMVLESIQFINGISIHVHPEDNLVL
jgi:cation diffusion facilitator family transporter